MGRRWTGWPTRSRCSRGSSLHAATDVEAGDKAGLERLCRYVARPPLAAGSLKQHSEDLLSFKLKTPWSDPPSQATADKWNYSSDSLSFRADRELCCNCAACCRITIMTDGMSISKSKLAALVPPPRKNIVRYHGVLGPHAKNRDKIVPAVDRDSEDKAAAPKRYRLKWAVLLARVFRVDVDKCPRCSGKMKIVAALTDPASIRQYLKGTGQCADVPGLSPARAPPQTEMDFDS